MLRLHLNVCCFVNVSRSFALFAVLDAHIDIEGLINLVLAVRNACFFSIRLGCKGVSVDTIKMAAAE